MASSVLLNTVCC